MSRKIAVVKVAERFHDSQLYQILLDIINKANELLGIRHVGTATLSGGRATILDSEVKADSTFTTPAYVTIRGVPGLLSVPASLRKAGRSFVIQSSSNADASDVSWEFTNP